MKRRFGVLVLALATAGVVITGVSVHHKSDKPPVVSAPSGHVIQSQSPLLNQTMHEIALEQMQNEKEEHEDNATIEEPDIEEDTESSQTTEDARTYLGTYRISHYCPCRKCNGGYSSTASGEDLQPGVSVAVDRNKIALGSTLYIDGYGERVAHDTGSAIKGERIDVCVDSHSEAYALGIVYRDVYIIK